MHRLAFCVWDFFGVEHFSALLFHMFLYFENKSKYMEQIILKLTHFQFMVCLA